MYAQLHRPPLQFLPIGDFDVVTGALNFDTPDCHVSGGCDLYTTKAAGSDKKLYKTIDRSLEAQHAALLKLGASLSPPQREEMAASLNLSRSSPFGPMSEISSRRTFAYLIATLNASHPDYDFSHVLRPTDFRRERNLRRVMINIDTTLGNARPHAAAAAASLDGSLPRASWASAGLSPAAAAAAAFSTTSPVWGPTAWAMLDKEMMLKDCTVFSYQPAESPFDEEEGAIWALHYLFFNKALKRVAYLYVRGQPVMSHSPSLRPFPRRRGGAAGLRGIDDDDDDDMTLPGTLGSGGAGGGVAGGVAGGSGSGASKRARFWLGDRSPDRVANSDDEEMSFDDGMLWNRDADGGIDYYQRFAPDEAFDDYDDDGMMIDDDEPEDEEDEEDEDGEDGEEDEGGVALQKTKSRSPVRGVSEDIASRMEI